MKSSNAQKFIERNRPPRVQIACDEEVNGAKIKVNLPFVAGVLADLSGKWEEDLDAVPDEFKSARGNLEERKFLEFDQGNFSERMKAIRPTVEFNVKDHVTGEKLLPVKMTFESMEDFEPHKVAEKIAPLRLLLENRKLLNELKNRATNTPALKKALEKILGNPDLIKALSEPSK